MSDNPVTNNYTAYENYVRTEMLPFIPADARLILDVGCSVGNFGPLVKEKNSATVYGVEIDKDAAEIASTRLDKVFCGAFDRSLGLPEREFDCVVFNDVLEHMIDPYSALEYAKILLSPNGCVVASIPNVRYFGNIWKLLMDGTWEYTDSGILDRTHLRFFTKKSIQTTFQRLGFEISEIEGINPVDSYDPELRQKFRYLNFALMKKIADMRWLQFAIVATPTTSLPKK